MQATAETRFLKIGAVAARFGVSPKTIRRLAEKDQLPPPVRFGRALRWPVAALEAWERERVEAA